MTKIPCMKTSSASDISLLVCQYTNKEGWKQFSCTTGSIAGCSTKRHRLWLGGHPEAPLGSPSAWPALGSGTHAAAVSPCVWQGRHSYQWWHHRVTGSTDSCHCTPKIWAEQEPVLLVKQPHIPHSREVCLLHLAFPLTSLLQYADFQHYFI